MGREIAALRPGDAKHDARIGLLDRILDRRQDPIGEFDIVGEVLAGVGARNFSVVLVHQLIDGDLSARDGRFEGIRNPSCGVDDDADKRGVGGLHAAIGDQRDQLLGNVEQPGHALVGMLEVVRRQVNALCEMAKLVDHAVTMGEIGGRRLRHAVDLAADGREALLHADDDALNLFGALAGALGARGDIVALADQIADLAVKVANGIADQMRGLPRRFGEAFHFAGDHRKAFACLAGARRFDGRIQREQIGLLGDRLDRSGHLRNLCQGASDSAQSGFDAADRFDQFGDVLDRGVHRDARLGDFTDGRGGSRLHRLRCVGDVVIGGDHRLGSLLQMPEAVGLDRHALCDLLHIAGNVGELDPEAPDLVRKLID